MLTLMFTLLLASLAESKDYPPSYEGPVVGILTQRAWGKMSFYGHSYLAASYVKFAELSGMELDFTWSVTLTIVWSRPLKVRVKVMVSVMRRFEVRVKVMVSVARDIRGYLLPHERLYQYP